VWKTEHLNILKERKKEGECVGNRDCCGEWKGTDMIAISSM
jgi:hypothetical protein